MNKFFVVATLATFALTACSEYTPKSPSHTYHGGGGGGSYNANPCGSCEQDMTPDGNVGDLVSEGSVNMTDNETKTDHGSDGPPSIDG